MSQSNKIELQLSWQEATVVMSTVKALNMVNPGRFTFVSTQSNPQNPQESDLLKITVESQTPNDRLTMQHNAAHYLDRFRQMPQSTSFEDAIDIIRRELHQDTHDH